MNFNKFKKFIDFLVLEFLLWFRKYRLYLLEMDKGVYMFVGMVFVVIFVIGYDGLLLLEIFVGFLYFFNFEVFDEYVKRGVDSLVRLCDSVVKVECFWGILVLEMMVYRFWWGGRIMEVEVLFKL